MTAVASAILLGLWTPAAQALSLGQINVKSTLGEPLSAEIDILDINPDEAATLVTKVAAPEAFKAAGLDYNAAVSSLRATLAQRSNGKPYIKLTGDRPVNDPFVDMIIEANWNTGRIVRDYTMLFDPPSFRATAPTPAPTLAQTSKAPPSTGTAKSAAPATPVKAAKTEPSPAVKKAANGDTPQQVTVKPGETAGHLAGTYKPVNVSLDQMLVALLRTNPDAFINNNVNRLKAGSLVNLPSETQAAETPPAQATQMILAQSQDFNNFRRSLASHAPVADVAPAKREASGKVQASVEDKKTPLVSTDKLTLSKGNLPGTSNAEQVAQARNAKVAADRAAELAKNLQDLSKIAAASSAAVSSSTPAVKASAAASASTAVASAVVASAATPSVAVASAAPASSAPVTPAVTAQTPAKPKPLAKAPEPAAEPSFMDDLLDNPMLPWGAGGLIAMLAGLGLYRANQRKKSGAQDSIFADSKLQPESFFGGTGGRNVNTNDAGVAGSSMMYSPSQLDAVDDVDPVAEADVYLAYGRDLQAEEILKDALRTTPDRLTIQQKLLEIYAKRRDAKAFESIATLAFNLTNGTGADWERICEKGLALEPDNALYLPGGQPLSEFKTTLNANDIEAPANTQPAEPSTQEPAQPSPLHDLGNLDLDLDLDFSLDEPQLTEHTGAGELSDLPEIPHALVAEMTADATAPSNDDTPAMQDDLPTAFAMDTSITPMSHTPAPAPELDANANPESDADLDFDLGLEDPSSRPAPLETPPKTEPATLAVDLKGDTGAMAFDLGELSLDFSSTGPGDLPNLGEVAETPAADPVVQDNPETQPGGYADVDGDPLETKLALADEFKAIGDEDGARALIEEVMAEASGEVKERAERALKRL